MSMYDKNHYNIVKKTKTKTKTRHQYVQAVHLK